MANEVDVGVEISGKLFQDLQRLQLELKEVGVLVERIGSHRQGSVGGFQQLKQEAKEFARQLQAIKMALDSAGSVKGLTTAQAQIRRHEVQRLAMTRDEAFKARNYARPLSAAKVQGLTMAELTQTKKLVGQLVGEAMAKGDKELAQAHLKVGQQMAEQLKSMQALIRQQTLIKQGNVAGVNRLNAQPYRDRQLNQLIYRALDKQNSNGTIAANARGQVASLSDALAASPTERKRLLEAQKMLFEGAMVDTLGIPKEVQTKAKAFYQQMDEAFTRANAAGKKEDQLRRRNRDDRVAYVANDYRDQELRRRALARQTTTGLHGYSDVRAAQDRLQVQEFRAGRALNDYRRLQTSELKEQLALEAQSLQQLKDWIAQTKAAQEAGKERARAHRQQVQERSRAEAEAAKLDSAEFGGATYRRNQKQRYVTATQGVSGLAGSLDLGEAKRRLAGQQARVGSAEVRLEREVTAENQKQLELERQALTALENRIHRLNQVKKLEDDRSKALLKAQNEEKAWSRKNDPAYMRRNAEHQRAMTRERMFGDGGASLMGIQATLLAHYALLSGVQGMFSGSANFILELDKGLRQLQSIVRITDNDMAGLSTRLIDISEITKFTALEVVQAATVLGQAGFGKRQIEDSMEAVTLFATAVGTDLNTAVDLATSTLGVFNKDADQMAVMVNQMTTAVNTSKLNLDKLTLGIQYAGNTAHQSNVPFEEVVATLGAMANSGIKSGSTLGTGLRQILITLQKPSKEFKQQMQDLGITMDQLDLNTHGLVGVMTTLAEKGYTTTDAMKTMEVRAAAAYGAFANNLSKAKEMMASLDDQTAAAAANETQMKALANQLDRLRSASLSMVNEGAKPTLSVLTEMVTKMADAAGAAQNFGNALAFVGTAATMLIGGGILGWMARLVRGLARVNPMLAASQRVAGATGGKYLLGGATLASATAGAYSYHQQSQAEVLSNRVDQTQTQVNHYGSEVDRLKGYSERVSAALEDVWRKRHLLEEDTAFQQMLRRMQTEFQNVGLVLDSSVTGVDGLIGKLRDLKVSLDDEYQLKVTLEQTALEEARLAMVDRLTAEHQQAQEDRAQREADRALLQRRDDRYAQVDHDRDQLELLRDGAYQAPSRPDNPDSFATWQDHNPDQEQLRQDAWSMVDRAVQAFDEGYPLSEEDRTRAQQDARAQLPPMRAKVEDLYQQLLETSAGEEVMVEIRALREQMKKTGESLSGLTRLGHDQDQNLQEQQQFEWLNQNRPQFEGRAQQLKDEVEALSQGLQRGDYSNDPIARKQLLMPQLDSSRQTLDNLLEDIRALDPKRATAMTQALGTESLLGTITGLQRDLREAAAKPEKRVLSSDLRSQGNINRSLQTQFDNVNDLASLERLRSERIAQEQQLADTQLKLDTLKTEPGTVEYDQIQANLELQLEEKLQAIERAYTVSRDVLSGNIDYSLAQTASDFDDQLASMVQNRVLYPAQRQLEAVDSRAKATSEGAKTRAGDLAEQRSQLMDLLGVEGLSRDERGALLDQALQLLADETRASRESLVALESGNREQLQLLTEQLATLRVNQDAAGPYTQTGQALGKAIERASSEQEKVQAELAKNSRQLEENSRASARQTQELRRQRNLDQYQGSNYQSAAYRRRRAEFGRSGVAGLGANEFHDSQGEVRSAGQGGWAATFDNVAQAYEGIDALTEVSLKAEETLGGLADNMANMWVQVAQGAMSADDAIRNLLMNTAGQMAQSALSGLLGNLIQYGAQAVAGYFGGGNSTAASTTVGGRPSGVAGRWQGGEIRGFYGGGVVMSGREDRDSTYIKAAKGEFVVRREAVQAIGVDTLQELNRLDRSTLKSQAAVSGQGRPPAPSPGKAGIQAVNVYVVSKDAVPNNLGPNDVVAIVSDDMARGGRTKKLIQQINAGHI